METFNGQWKIKDKLYSGVCEVNNNDIILTLFKENIENEVKYITSTIGSNDITLYYPFLIFIDSNCIKYKAPYIVKQKHFFANDLSYDIKEKFLWKEEKKLISKIKFFVPNLDDWINKEKMLLKKNNIKVLDIDKITLLDNEYAKIYIEYNVVGKNSIDKSNNLESVKNIPYVNVEFNNLCSLADVYRLIKIINRFFSLLIGFCEDIDKVEFFVENDDTKKFELYLNFPSNHNLDVKMRYINPRVDFADIKDNITLLFENWFKFYNSKNCELPINLYFLFNNRSIVEEKFLQLCRVIECFYDIKNPINDEKLKSKCNVISTFIEQNKEEIKKILNDNNLKSKNIREVSSAINVGIESLTDYEYIKVALETKIKEIDTYNIILNYFNINDLDEKQDVNGYKVINNTRNHYIHLNNNKCIISEKYIEKYVLILDLILILYLLNKISVDEEIIEHVKESEPHIMLNLYINN